MYIIIIILTNTMQGSAQEFLSGDLTWIKVTGLTGFQWVVPVSVTMNYNNTYTERQARCLVLMDP